jgi:Rap1a immunity proteins
MPHRSKPALALPAGAALAILMLAPAHAQTVSTAAGPPPDTTFQVATTSDLVRLCEAEPNGPTGIAALHFCQGFAVGAYRYHQIASSAADKPPLFCEPTPRPTRNQVTAAFIDWAQQHPDRMNVPAVEGLFQFLAQAYPCRS